MVNPEFLDTEEYLDFVTDKVNEITDNFDFSILTYIDTAFERTYKVSDRFIDHITEDGRFELLGEKIYDDEEFTERRYLPNEWSAITCKLLYDIMYALPMDSSTSVLYHKYGPLRVSRDISTDIVTVEAVLPFEEKYSTNCSYDIISPLSMKIDKVLTEQVNKFYCKLYDEDE